MQITFQQMRELYDRNLPHLLRMVWDMTGDEQLVREIAEKMMRSKGNELAEPQEE
jgi:hypothetical protein